MTTDLAALLVERADELARRVRREGSALLRFESEEDLVQGIHLRALAMASRFEFRGEASFRAWLLGVARAHLADRRDYWHALKRRSGQVLRLTWSGLSAGTVTRERLPASTATGPSTFASRREDLALVARALGLLSARDRELVEWQSEEVALTEQARRLGLAEDSARRAGHRALERFKKTWRLLKQGAPPRGPAP